MKTGLLSLCICIAFKARSQESLKVPDVPFVFEYDKEAKISSKQVNDTLVATVTKQGSNFNINLLDRNQKTLCSCLFKPSGKQEELETVKSDTTASRERKLIKGKMVIRWLEPVGENCIVKYRAAFL